jgi:hypothetical protein
MEEEVIGAIGHERLLAYIAGNRAPRGGSRSSISIESLKERGLVLPVVRFVTFARSLVVISLPSLVGCEVVRALIGGRCEPSA